MPPRSYPRLLWAVRKALLRLTATYNESVQLTIELPEDVLQALTNRCENVPRYALEALAVEGYRCGALTETQIKRMLGYETRMQVHALLKEHGVSLHYSGVDLSTDLDAHRELGILPGR